MHGNPSYSSYNVELTELHVQGTVIGGAEENQFIAKSKLGRSSKCRLPPLLLVLGGLYKEGS